MFTTQQERKLVLENIKTHKSLIVKNAILNSEDLEQLEKIINGSEVSSADQAAKKVLLLIDFSDSQLGSRDAVHHYAGSFGSRPGKIFPKHFESVGELAEPSKTRKFYSPLNLMIVQRFLKIVEAQNNGLEVLRMAGTNLNEEEVIAIGTSLNNKKFTYLKELDLSRNSLNEQGLQLIAKLKDSTRLQTLKLNYCTIKDNSINKFLMSLSHNSYLRRLEIGGISLNEEGVAALKELIGTSPRLTSVEYSLEETSPDEAKRVNEEIRALLLINKNRVAAEQDKLISERHRLREAEQLVKEGSSSPWLGMLLGRTKSTQELQANLQELSGNLNVSLTEVVIETAFVDAMLDSISAQKNNNHYQAVAQPAQLNLPRKGLTTREEMSHQQMMNVLPGDQQWGFGKAVDNPDCFYDAIAQGIDTCMLDNAGHTVKSLRVMCGEYIQELHKDPSRNNWVKEAIEELKGPHDYFAHLNLVHDTHGELTAQGKNAILGKPHIEGRIIAEKLDCILHVIEFYESSNSMERLSSRHLLVSKEGVKQIDGAGINYKDNNTLHLVIYRNHCVPILPCLRLLKDSLKQESRQEAMEGLPAKMLVTIADQIGDCEMNVKAKSDLIESKAVSGVMSAFTEADRERYQKKFQDYIQGITLKYRQYAVTVTDPIKLKDELTQQLKELTNKKKSIENDLMNIEETNQAAAREIKSRYQELQLLQREHDLTDDYYDYFSDISKRFLEQAIDVNAPLENGSTLLELAYELDNEQAVELLLIHGANPLLKNQKGESIFLNLFNQQSQGAKKSAVKVIQHLKKKVQELWPDELQITHSNEMMRLQDLKLHLDGYFEELIKWAETSYAWKLLSGGIGQKENRIQELREHYSYIKMGAHPGDLMAALEKMIELASNAKRGLLNRSQLHGKVKDIAVSFRDDLEAMNRKLREENLQLMSDLDRSRQQLMVSEEKCQALQKENQDKDEQIVVLKSDLSKSQMEVIEFKKKFDDSQIELSELKIKLGESQRESSEIKQEAAEIKQEAAEIKQKNAEIERKYSEVVKQNAEIKQENAEIKEELNEVKKMLQILLGQSERRDANDNSKDGANDETTKTVSPSFFK